MIDLKATSGMPLAVDDSRPDLPLILDGGLRPGRREDRALDELRPTLANPTANGPDPAYFMHRGIGRLSALAANGGRIYNWRYDVTIFPSGKYGDEYLRTIGHYHPPAKGTSTAYPEVYEVLSGTALFVLQRVDDYRAGPEKVRVQDLILLRAEVGEKAMMLPGYGHWTVNVTGEPLIVSNWICGDFASHYDSAKAARGPCCYVIAGGNGPKLSRNPLYRHPPADVKHAQTADVPELGLVAGRPIFGALLAAPSRWQYLCDPDAAPIDLGVAIEVSGTEPFPA
jgi:glucose-6-phosphate isomerase